VEVKLHIDPIVPPVAQKVRQIAFRLQKMMEKELKNLEQEDIIKKVYGPTPWVSPLVVMYTCVLTCEWQTS